MYNNRQTNNFGNQGSLNPNFFAATTTAVTSSDNNNMPGSSANDHRNQNMNENFVAAAPSGREIGFNLNTFQPTSEGSSQDNPMNCEGRDELAIDPDNMLHHLQNRWTMWYLENDRSKSWEDMQNEITTFSTVEDFWKLYSHIKAPSDLRVGCDYSLFKQGIRPMWEDMANKEGGRWIITFNKNSKIDLDNLWLDVMLCMIGETFDNANEICGAVVNIRGKHDRISIWTANGSNEKAVLEIGCKLRDTLHLGYQNLQYQFHRDTKTTYVL